MSEHAPAADEPSIFNDADEGVGKGIVRIASVAALGGLLFGYDSAVINGAVESIRLEFGDVAADGSIVPVNDGVLGFAVASALIGAAAGAMTSGRIADRIGRLKVMKIAAILFLVSAIGTGLAHQLWMLVFFRIVGGIAVGMASVIAPAYIAETSPARIRGRLGSLQQLAIVVGIFLSFLVNWLLAEIAGSASDTLWLGMEAWRWMFFAMAIPSIVYGLLATTIPESPRYLVSQHQIPEARKVLTRLLGEKNLELTIDRIQRSLERDTKPSWRDLRGPSGRVSTIVWVGLLLSVFQQAVGINVIFYYSNTLWQAVGFDESSSNVISVITSVVNIAVTIVAILLVDKIGRKPLLLIGSIGMSVSLGLMAICFANATFTTETDSLGELVQVPHLDGAFGPIALVAANLFVIFFGASWGPVVWVLLGEMFPNRIRAAALSLAAAGQWAMNWVVTVSFPALKSFSLGFAYGLYTLFAVVSIFFVLRFVRETKGMTLEDMDDVGGDDRPPRTKRPKRTRRA